jgi:dihydrofolate reductase
MARLVYSMITSLDGYVADTEGTFDWAEPDAEVHRFVNDQERPVGTYLYGRKLYETMAVWEDPALVEGEPEEMHDYAEIWKAADKIVYSRTLERVSTPRTHLERDFDADAIRALKDASARDISIGGPHLAASAIAAGLVDDFHFFLVPVAVGGGNRALPEGVRVPLELVSERRFGNGTVHLHYRAAR